MWYYHPSEFSLPPLRKRYFPQHLRPSQSMSALGPLVCRLRSHKETSIHIYVHNYYFLFRLLKPRNSKTNSMAHIIKRTIISSYMSRADWFLPEMVVMSSSQPVYADTVFLQNNSKKGIWNKFTNLSNPGLCY